MARPPIGIKGRVGPQRRYPFSSASIATPGGSGRLRDGDRRLLARQGCGH